MTKSYADLFQELPKWLLPLHICESTLANKKNDVSNSHSRLLITQNHS